MVWVVERSDLNNYEYNVSAWLSEADALKQAVHEMVAHINKIYHADDADLIDAVKEIDELLQAKNQRAAIDLWNDCCYNIDQSSPVYWSVTDYSVKVYGGGPIAFNKKKYPFLDSAAQSAAPTNGLINNHTCVLCGNTKLNRSEKSCWSCGTPI
ncbi:MAG TPA: hypothetical protein VGK47_01345 [Nitrososphaeraceae archaeon]